MSIICLVLLYDIGRESKTETLMKSILTLTDNRFKTGYLTFQLSQGESSNFKSYSWMPSALMVIEISSIAA